VTKATFKTCGVLGGKGFVGSGLVEIARQRGYDVTAIDVDEYQANVGKSFDLFINANGNSKKFLAAENPSLEFDLSVRSVARSLQDFKSGLCVHLSTIDVYPNHENPSANEETAPIDISAVSPYGLHKFMAEQLVRFYAKRWLIFRMGGFVGSGLWKNSIYDLIKKKPLRVHPDSVYQYLHKLDLARAIFTVIEKGVEGELFNIAGTGLISLREAAAEVPGYQFAPDAETMKRETYEVSTKKLSALAPLPRSADTVKTFIRDVLSGKETIR
jgi:nucleoside-diphosphate-sugar epimerase